MGDILLMSVDLGTSFIKVGVYDVKSNCIAIAQEPVLDERPAPGIFLQRGEYLFSSVIRCMEKVTAILGERIKNVEAISFTGQMAGFMGVDKNWKDITTWSCSLDTRYIPYANRQLSTLAKEFLDISATNSPQMAPKYEWFKCEFPDQSKNIAKYIMISSYVIGKLGNLPIEEAVIDSSYIAFTGLADIQNDCWSEVICNALGIDRKYLPRIVKSNEVCGKLCKEIARITGLKEGIPLISGAGDKAAGAVGAGILDTGDMIFEASSYGGFSCMIDDYRPDHKGNYYDAIPSVVDGKLYAHHYIPGSGITLKWFINTFVRTMDGDINQAFMEMDKKVAKLSPGSDGIFAIGLLGGSAMPFDGELRGMWMGYSWSHRQEHFYRALLESISFDLSLTIDSLQSMYPEYELNTVKMIGGGAKSKVWMQMLADITGKRFQRLNREDIALWGTAILAGSGIGLFDDIKSIAMQNISICETYEPNEIVHNEYKKFKRLYQEYIIEFHNFYTRLKDISM